MRSTAPLLLLSLAMLGGSSSARAGEPAPEIHAETLQRRPVSLAALKGHVVVLDFWAPWCVPCRTSFPFLDTLRKRHGAQGLEVVGLTLDESPEAIFAFLDSVPVGFTVARDPSGRSGEAFHVVAMPTTFLIDRNGDVVARFEGGDRRVHERIEGAVASLMEGKTLAADVDVRVAPSVQATGSLKAWQRGTLADPMMSLDGDPLTRLLREHVHASKEGAAGDGGAAGGGCGCN